MKKIYFLQKIHSLAVYQLDLSQYLPNVSYRNIFNSIFHCFDYDLKETEFYDLLCILFSELSGYNRSNGYYKNLKLYFEEYFGSVVYKSLRGFLKDHYKCIATTHIYFNLNPESYGKYR